jgi:hypothetical protein
MMLHNIYKPQRPIVGGLYRYYCNHDVWEVVAIAKEFAAAPEFVVIRHYYEHIQHFEWCVISLERFLDIVHHDGGITPRFVHVRRHGPIQEWTIPLAE